MRSAYDDPDLFPSLPFDGVIGMSGPKRMIGTGTFLFVVVIVFANLVPESRSSPALGAVLLLGLGCLAIAAAWQWVRGPGAVRWALVWTACSVGSFVIGGGIMVSGGVEIAFSFGATFFVMATIQRIPRSWHREP